MKKTDFLYVITIFFLFFSTGFLAQANDSLDGFKAGPSVFCRGPGGSSGGNDWFYQPLQKALDLIIEASKNIDSPELNNKIGKTKISYQPVVTVDPECGRKQGEDGTKSLVLNEISSHLSLQSSILDWAYFLVGQMKSQDRIDASEERQLIHQLNYLSKTFNF